MSRCFPFPPPGYEKKARTDDTDLLKKEKHREKKQKREKDKEKREGKEKREKDRSDGKHRDKKERKEKHGDKKKDKEKYRDKDKDKGNTSEEKSNTGQSEIYNGGDKDKGNTSEEKSNTGQSEIYNGGKLNEKERDQDKDKSSIPYEREQGHNGEKPSQNSVLGRRIRDEENRNGSQLVERIRVPEQKSDVQIDEVVVTDTGILAEGMQNNKGKRIDDRKIDGQGRLFETSNERRMEEKENSKEVKGDKKRGDKRKNKDKEKKSHGKDKEREKEKKKVEVSENKSEDQDKYKDRIKNDLHRAQDIKMLHVFKNGDSNTGTEGNLKKRKEFEPNGFLHETDIRPSKMPRPSPHPSTENGRKLVPCRPPMLSSSDCLGPPNNLKLDNKEHKVNGVIGAHSLSLSSKRSSAIPPADQTAQDSMKPLHPDSKYFSKTSSAIPPADQIVQDFVKPTHPDSKYLSKTSSAIAPADQIVQASVKPPHPESKHLRKKSSAIPPADQIVQASMKPPPPDSKYLSKKSSGIPPADQILEASKKPPHPDSKYLDQVLSVPKLKEWSDFDDQEWLFSSRNGRSSEKPDAGSSEIPRVWAEALRIESADVCALPYVIPY
ncbi:hypothetical protein RHMOL_Rhmol09G0076900 [Rhododendron molle]|uniref:Uncharacterized protein n=1 Tax=Rhododendron molle TaxID=49168 RepID=A0ACC0MB91_RHOML|nr:hypothetical protein RHMOL_Rhmol09G0076900 [Rhododendron molle]